MNGYNHHTPLWSIPRKPTLLCVWGTHLIPAQNSSQTATSTIRFGDRSIQPPQKMADLGNEITIDIPRNTTEKDQLHVQTPFLRQQTGEHPLRTSRRRRFFAGDLGHFSKTSPWEPSVHVPVLVTGPSLPQNVVVDHPVSLIDVPWPWHPWIPWQLQFSLQPSWGWSKMKNEMIYGFPICSMVLIYLPTFEWFLG